MHYARSRKIGIAMAQVEVRTQERQPSAAPCPVRKDRIGDCADEHRRDRKRDVFPSFRCGACHNRQRRIHEHHLEQEHHHDSDVIGVGLRQKESVRAPQAPGFSEQVDCVLGIERVPTT